MKLTYHNYLFDESHLSEKLVESLNGSGLLSTSAILPDQWDYLQASTNLDLEASKIEPVLILLFVEEQLLPVVCFKND